MFAESELIMNELTAKVRTKVNNQTVEDTCTYKAFTDIEDLQEYINNASDTEHAKLIASINEITKIRAQDVKRRELQEQDDSKRLYKATLAKLKSMNEAELAEFAKEQNIEL